MRMTMIWTIKIIRTVLLVEKGEIKTLITVLKYAHFGTMLIVPVTMQIRRGIHYCEMTSVFQFSNRNLFSINYECRMSVEKCVKWSFIDILINIVIYRKQLSIRHHYLAIHSLIITVCHFIFSTQDMKIIVKISLKNYTKWLK